MGLTVAEARIVGRLTGGILDDLTAEEVRVFLNVANGANVTEASLVPITNAAPFGFVSNDATMAANSASILPTQAAVKAYALAVATTGGIAASLADAVGDILIATADNTWGRLAKPTNPGYVFGILADGTMGYRNARAHPQLTGTSASTSLTLSGFTPMGMILGLNNSAAIACTVPPNTSFAVEIGQSIDLWQMGTGQVTFVQGAGVTIHTAASYKTRAQYSLVTLVKVAADEWELAGDLQPLGQTINPQVGTSYNFVAGDVDRLVTGTNGSAQTYTLPTNASQPIDVGQRIDVAQLGAGQITIAGAGGVSVNGNPGLKTAGQYARIYAEKIATDAWLLDGKLAA